MTGAFLFITLIEVIVFVFIACLFFGVTAQRRIDSEFYRESGWELQRFKDKYERELEVASKNTQESEKVYTAAGLHLERSRRLLEEIEADKAETLRKLQDADALLQRIGVSE
jgi:hypothetical protein